MGRVSNYRKGPWTKEEDKLLRECVKMYGEGSWRHIPSRTGLNRCRKSCRLRWLNYLRPNIRKGDFEVDEIDLIIRLHRLLGNRWTLIAGRIPGRTANDVKNFWNSQLSKKLRSKQHISSSCCKKQLHETDSLKMNSSSLRGASESSPSKQRPPREEEEEEEEKDGGDEEGEEEEEATLSFWKRMLIKGEEMQTNSTNLQVQKKDMVSAEDDFFVGVDKLLQEMDMELWDVFGSHQGQQ